MIVIIIIIINVVTIIVTHPRLKLVLKKNSEEAAHKMRTRVIVQPVGSKI